VKKAMSEWIKKHLPVVIIVAIGIVTVIFIAYLVTLPMPGPPY
jgi:Na+/glutamate symporter